MARICISAHYLSCHQAARAPGSGPRRTFLHWFFHRVLD
jgi:hypothetical protein